MGYIGNQAVQGYSSIPAKQDLTGATGGTLTLTHAVSSPEAIDLYINNVRQEPTTSYGVAGTTVTLNGYTVAASDDIYVVYNALAQQTSTHPSNQALQATSGTFSSNVDVGGSLLVDTIKDSTGTNTALSIDSSGRVTMPNTNTAQIDMWRLTTNFGTNNATVTGWEQPDDTYFAVAGTSMSESSGVFTFPNTGLWRIGMAVQFSLTSGDTSAGVNLEVSTNSGSTYDNTAGSFEAYGSAASGFNHALVNVTDASTFRTKLITSGINTGTVIVGNTNKNQTTLMFERITDSQ